MTIKIYKKDKLQPSRMHYSLFEKAKQIIQDQESKTGVKTLLARQTTEEDDSCKKYCKRARELESETGVKIL